MLDEQQKSIPLAHLMRIGGEAPVLLSEELSQWQRLRRWLIQRFWPLVLVVLPAVLAVIYFGLIESDRYVSEAKFVVRAPSTGGIGQIANVLQGSGIVKSADDAYVVHGYLESRDALLELTKSAGLKEIFSRSEADFLSRYPKFYRKANIEDLYKHYLKFVYLDYNQTTGISLLRVQAFRAKDAHDLAAAMLDNAEVLINRLNERAQQDAIENALKEIEYSQERALAAQTKVTDFRTRESLIDPNLTSKSMLEAITKLSVEIAQASAQAIELGKAAPQSPQLATIRTRISSLQEEVQKQRQMLGGSSSALAPKIAEYDRLMLETEFATHSFLTAMASLETARQDARKQKIFLDRVAEPSMPDLPTYPYRLLSIGIVSILAYLLYRIGALLVKDTLGHAVK
jgi:capsular polysaccharide transport system permease protein